MGLLDNKVCVITGGAGSVGLASAHAFLREGAKVMIVDLKDADLARAAKALNSANVATCAADVTKTDDVKGYFDATAKKFGKIDVLFSNAGNSGVVTPVTEYPEDVFDSVIAVHIRGAFLACKYGLPQMNDGGSIIITSSIVGVKGDGGGAVAYVTAKHAQVGLMRSVSKNAARRNIRVNTLHPGPIDNQFQLNIEDGITKLAGRNGTELLNEAIPLHRHARAEEIAQSALFLASNMSSFTTGATILADGGLSS
ncbi:MAG TPA: SDR family oxidoreductase [Xanthobacteraceae bacterium]|jgi:NAD(P)-dependent dehydrogenase (short-subunit alcohol dehydrogenase family)|nr:SDR family oxidoreductase [Xanthobacteraceae bacterium]